MNRLAMKHTCLSFAIATLHTYIATIALYQNFHGGTSMAWTFIPTWTTSPLNFTYNMHFRLKNEGKSRISSRFCRYILKYNASLSKNMLSLLLVYCSLICSRRLLASITVTDAYSYRYWPVCYSVLSTGRYS